MTIYLGTQDLYGLAANLGTSEKPDLRLISKGMTQPNADFLVDRLNELPANRQSPNGHRK